MTKRMSVSEAKRELAEYKQRLVMAQRAPSSRSAREAANYLRFRIGELEHALKQYRKERNDNA